MARRLEGLLGAGVAVGVALVWLAQYLGEPAGPLAWLGGGLLLIVSVSGLLLPGTLTITGRTYRRRTWRPTQALTAGHPEYERQLATSRTKSTPRTPGGPGTSWAPPMLIGQGRLVSCSTLEIAVNVEADLDRTAQVVKAALVSPGWEAAATDTLVDAQGEVVHVTRAPEGPADRDATYLGQEAVGGLTRSPRVIVRTSLRRTGPTQTAVTLSGACSATMWGDKRRSRTPDRRAPDSHRSCPGAAGYTRAGMLRGPCGAPGRPRGRGSPTDDPVGWYAAPTANQPMPLRQFAPGEAALTTIERHSRTSGTAVGDDRIRRTSRPGAPPTPAPRSSGARGGARPWPLRSHWRWPPELAGPEPRPCRARRTGLPAPGPPANGSR